ncbi:MAG: hypothetical protein LBD48_11435 [Treponema sp.]|jgi:hypothetical protein|nr:hypothetical protein [Treponema sp.]
MKKPTAYNSYVIDNQPSPENKYRDYQIRRAVWLPVFCGLALFAASCDLFNSKPEIDLEKSIDAKILYANAPVINISVANTGGGVTNPAGTLTGKKLGYPFRLNFAVNPNFGFIRWKAELNGVELGPDKYAQINYVRERLFYL